MTADYMRISSGQYHKVGEAGRLGLWVANDNIGTHWLVTRAEELVFKDYHQRPSVRLLRQRESEWNLAFTRWGKEPKPFSASVPEGTPTNWKRVENSSAEFSGRKGY